jgi:hypothetical protein
VPVFTGSNGGGVMPEKWGGMEDCFPAVLTDVAEIDPNCLWPGCRKEHPFFKAECDI